MRRQLTNEKAASTHADADKTKQHTSTKNPIVNTGGDSGSSDKSRVQASSHSTHRHVDITAKALAPITTTVVANANIPRSVKYSRKPVAVVNLVHGKKGTTRHRSKPDISSLDASKNTNTANQLTMGNVHQGHPISKGSSVSGRLAVDQRANMSQNQSLQSDQVPISKQPPVPTRSLNGVVMTEAKPISSGLRSNLSSADANAEMESVLQTLSSDILELKATVREKDRQMLELRSQVSKITAVFQQHVPQCEIWKQNPPPIVEAMLHRDPALLKQLSAKDGSLIALSSEVHTSVDEDELSPLPILEISNNLNLIKRLGVSAEPSRVAKGDVRLTFHDKDAKSRQLIRDALRKNGLLTDLDAVQVQRFVSCMHEQTVPAGSFIIREGEDGVHLYVVAVGEFEVWKEGKYLSTLGPGQSFGELALLYSCKRTASVKAVVTARVWVLESAVFRYIMMETGMQKMHERLTFLSSVPLLRPLPRAQQQKVADLLEAQAFPDGECIIRQGVQADSFFIIQSGEVRVTVKAVAPDKEPATVTEVEVRHMGKGEYFGEKALLGEGRRTANVYAACKDGVELLCLYRKDFLELIGNIKELQNKEYVDTQQILDSKGKLVPISSEPTSSSDPNLVSPSPKLLLTDHAMSSLSSHEMKVAPPVPVRSPLTEAVANLRLDGLLRVAIIGQGGFGRVELVHPKGNDNVSYALKIMKKAHIVATKQQEHIHSEKRILMSLCCPFICRLFKTFKDNKFVYILLEFCGGGELWTVLRDKHHFDDKQTRFSLGCVVEAFNFLHSQGIIYRDLKPENLLLDKNGYIKLCDFGFAKHIGFDRKTWTFCGTPEYVAPEVIRNMGHDFAADYWSLGILTCELLMGTPPFQAADPIKIYMKTLKGIEAHNLAQHKYIGQKAYQFIKKLCRLNPTERLGVGRLGIQEIRSHKYFQGFDWEGVAARTFQSPFEPKLSGPLDVRNFDRFPCVEETVPDEMSGWDQGF